MKRSLAVAGLAALSIAVAVPATAQSLSGIKVEPAVAKVGEPVKITGVFDRAGNPNCNLRVQYGDGAEKNFRINQEKDVPLVTSHSYAKPGTYKVAVLPRTDLPAIKCMGADQRATVKIEAIAPLAAAGAASAAAAPACPAGWKLDAKSVNRKSGAFTCTAKAGTVLPAARQECPAPLSYFENKAKGQLGCKA